MRMHANRRRIQNRSEILRTQCASRNSLAAYGASEFLRSRVTPRANENVRAGTRQRKRSRARGTARTKHKHSASTQLHPAFERAQYAGVVGIATIQRPVALHADCIHRSDFRSERLAIFQILEDSLLVWNRDAEAAHSEHRNRVKKILQIVHEKWEVDRAAFARNIANVVHQRRKRMPNRIANHSVHIRAMS